MRTWNRKWWGYFHLKKRRLSYIHKLWKSHAGLNAYMSQEVLCKEAAISQSSLSFISRTRKHPYS
jgi:hypothetical protein